MKGQVKDFFDRLECEGTELKAPDDAKKHFTHWMENKLELISQTPSKGDISNKKFKILEWGNE